MAYYIIFIVCMPAFTYIDYRCYKKRISKFLEEQPDHAANAENYQILFEKMCRNQKKNSVLICALICVIALIMLLLTLKATLAA